MARRVTSNTRRADLCDRELLAAHQVVAGFHSGELQDGALIGGKRLQAAHCDEA